MVDRAHSIVGDHKAGRPVDDFYPTPARAVDALMYWALNNDVTAGGNGFSGRQKTFQNHIWEPACGRGDISKTLDLDFGKFVYSSDLYDHGYGIPGKDFLTATYPYPDQPFSIITNPPFSLAEQFVERAIFGTAAYSVALLAKLAFLEGKKRTELLEKTPLARILVFRRRLSMYRDGKPMKNSGMIAFAWFYWIRGYTGRPVVEWL